VRLRIGLLPIVLATFVLTGAIPEAPLHVHHHDGGALPHVHPDAELHHHHDKDRHHHHAAGEVERHADEPAGPGIAAGDAAPGHAHWQAPFRRATRVAAPALVYVDRVQPLRTDPVIEAPAAARVRARSRAPPRA